MRGIISLAFGLFVLFAGPMRAQDIVWVQIESHPSLVTAQDRARAYAGVIDNLNGFSLGVGWYTLAIGPFDDAAARATLTRLRTQGLIPRDSFVSDGAAYSDPFWPIGSTALTAPVIVPAAPPAVTLPPVVEVAPAAPAPADIPAAQPTPEPQETLREAQRSEGALSRTEREDLQTALQWFGFYDAAIDGAFGRGTRASMAAWQTASGFEPTGVLTTRQRAQLLGDYAGALSALGLERITDDAAGLELDAPMGLVQFERYEAPFAHYGPRDGSGVRMILISQTGDRGTLNGLYEILQTLDVVPAAGARSKDRDAFSIRGEGDAFTSETRVRLRDGHIYGFMLVWPPAQEDNIGRVLPQMEASMRSVGPAMDPVEGFDPSQQNVDLVSGLDVRRPLRSRSGFFVGDGGQVLTSPDVAQGCARLTIDQLHDTNVIYSDASVAILAPRDPLAPVSVAEFADVPARLRSAIALAGFPYEGILGAATLTFGTLEDLKGLSGEPDVLRLSLTAQPGDVGGPVFDETGAVAGMLMGPDTGGRTLPAGVAFAIKSETLRGLLSAQGITPVMSTATTSMAPEDLTIRAADMTVLVSCWE